MNDDASLLRRYADEGSDDAFTELVRRHVDLVYGAAMRRTGGDAHAAADVAQQVFTTLAREARRLTRHTVLSAWLHTATRNAALNLMISEQRRKARERKAVTLDVASDSDPIDVLEWNRVRPLLDTAIDELNETDRSAVILRFLEHKPFAAIGAALNLTEDAARMRTDRALDKLRALLARRGITSKAAALGTLVSTQPLTSAPAGLAATLASQSLAASSAGALGGIAVFLSSLMNTKLIVTGLGSALAAFAVGAYVGLDHANSVPVDPPPETPRQVQLIASLRQENQQLKAELARVSAAAARPAAPTPERTSPPATTPAPTAMAPRSAAVQQRAIMNYLRQIEAARDQFVLEHKRAPTSLDELVGVTKYIKEIVPLAGETYTGLNLAGGVPLTVTMPDGTSVTYDPSGVLTTKLPPLPPEEIADQAARRRLQELNQKVAPSATKAFEAYRAAHNGAQPPVPESVVPYFATTEEAADFMELIEAQKAIRRP